MNELNFSHQFCEGDHPTQFNFRQKFFVQSSNKELGNRINLPPSVLSRLQHHPKLTFPLIFEVITTFGLRSFAGVLEFTAKEGVKYCEYIYIFLFFKKIIITHQKYLFFVYQLKFEGYCVMPSLFIKSLCLTEGSVVQLRTVNLLPATYLKLEPHSKKFLQLGSTQEVCINNLSTCFWFIVYLTWIYRSLRSAVCLLDELNCLFVCSWIRTTFRSVYLICLELFALGLELFIYYVYLLIVYLLRSG